MANKEFFDDRLEHIARLLDTTVLNLNKIKDMIIKLDFDEKRDLYRNVAGVSGTFDGTHMVGEDGKRYEIPANYSAKTRIVYGDVLKMIEEDGKHVFKQITKVPRKKVEGVLTKKEGK